MFAVAECHSREPVAQEYVGEYLAVKVVAKEQAIAAGAVDRVAYDFRPAEVAQEFRPDTMAQRRPWLRRIKIADRIKDDVLADVVGVGIAVDGGAIVECCHALSENVAFDSLAVGADNNTCIAGFGQTVILEVDAVAGPLRVADDDAGSVPRAAAAQARHGADPVEPVALDNGSAGARWILVPEDSDVQDVAERAVLDMGSIRAPTAVQPGVADLLDHAALYRAAGRQRNTSAGVLAQSDPLECAAGNRDGLIPDGRFHDHGCGRGSRRRIYVEHSSAAVPEPFARRV